MARRAQPLSAASGIAAALLVLAVILGALLAVFLRAGDSGGGLGRYDLAALRFTVLQAALSAGLSVLLAIPVARALARRSFRARPLLVALMGAPFLLPVIVAILGLLTVFGRSGWLSTALGLFGLPPVQIYGLHGVVLAHVFFNLPLATRLILQGWQAIPSERFRLAAQLGCGPRDIARLLEWPMLAQAVPGALAVIFAICLTSFAVALTLGGGPRATTLELAIYQAFRFDFDLGRAALLACLQLAVAGVAGLAALSFLPGAGAGVGAGADRPIQRWDASGRRARLVDTVAITAAALFLFLPMLAVVTAGLPGLVRLPAPVWHAAGLSCLIAITSTPLAMGLAIPMAGAVALRGRGWLEAVGLLGLTASPLVVGTGLFVILNPWVDPFALTVPVTAAVNAITALPFVLRALVPAARDVVADYGRLALGLGMGGLPFWRWVLLPRLRRQIGFAAGLTAALSMGDLGVIAMFADPQRATLPLQIYRLMGSYRMEAAAGAALLLLGLSFAAFWLLDRGGQIGAEA